MSLSYKRIGKLHGALRKRNNTNETKRTTTTTTKKDSIKNVSHFMRRYYSMDTAIKTLSKQEFLIKPLISESKRQFPSINPRHNFF